MQRNVINIDRVTEQGTPMLYLTLDCGHQDAVKDFGRRPPVVWNCTVCDTQPEKR
jgi:hypothetical protein